MPSIWIKRAPFFALLICLANPLPAKASLFGKKKQTEPADPNLVRLMMKGFEENLREVQVRKNELSKQFGHGVSEIRPIPAALGALCGSHSIAGLEKSLNYLLSLEEPGKLLLSQAEALPNLDTEDLNFCSSGLEKMFGERELAFKKAASDLQNTGLERDTRAFHRSLAFEKEALNRMLEKNGSCSGHAQSDSSLFSCQCVAAHGPELSAKLSKLEQWSKRLLESTTELQRSINSVARGARSLAAYETGQKQSCGQAAARSPASGNCNGQRLVGFVTVGVCVNTNVVQDLERAKIKRP